MPHNCVRVEVEKLEVVGDAFCLWAVTFMCISVALGNLCVPIVLLYIRAQSAYWQVFFIVSYSCAEAPDTWVVGLHRAQVKKVSCKSRESCGWVCRER